MNNTNKKNIGVLKFLSKKIIFISIILITIIIISVLCAPTIIDALTVKHVTVTLDDSIETTTTEYESHAETVGEFIEENDINFVKDRDVIDVSLDTIIDEEIKFSITKAIEISLTSDGETQEFYILPTDVKSILSKYEISLSDEDFVEPDLSHIVQSGDSIKVTRVTSEYEYEYESVPYSSYSEETSSLPIGEIALIQNGQEQITTNTFEVVYHDGVEQSRELIDSVEEQSLQDEILGYGVGMSWGKPEGLSYSKAIGVKAVAYSAPAGSYGAYGGYCEYGTCAVDPSIIPLGSRLYIEGYGYAYANDVGTAIKGNVVDLFMEDNSQCYIWGARQTTVYILD